MDWHTKFYPFGNLFLNICSIKAQKATSPCNNGATIHKKTPVLFLWLGGATFLWVASGYKFDIMNI